VIHLFKSKELGTLETEVMEVVWKRGESSVHDVTERLARPLAYTTVMTTLDRLYKKGLLERRKLDRAFLYTPKMSRQEWEKHQAGALISGILLSREHSKEVLISSLVEAVGSHDASLLDALEKKIREKRREMEEKS
jgi:predicted transcriptional regulator